MTKIKITREQIQSRQDSLKIMYRQAKSVQNIIIECPSCRTKNQIRDASRETLRDGHSCFSCKTIIAREAILLQHILHEHKAEIHSEIHQNYIVLPFVSLGNDVIESGTRVELIAYWRKDIISIELHLLELQEADQCKLDPNLIYMLLKENYSMNFCKFCLGPNGLSILVDIDAHNLYYEEIESGICSLLEGFERYVKILRSWFYILKEAGDVQFEEKEQYEKVDEAPLTTKKEMVFRALIGVAKFGLKVAILAGIAAILGVPTAGILTAAAGGVVKT